MRLLVVAIAALAAAPACAQQDLSKVEVKVEKIAPGVAVLHGDHTGGNEAMGKRAR
jgi:cyclase